MNIERAALHRRDYPILGRRLGLIGNDTRIAAMADRAFGHWLDLSADLIDPASPVEMTIRLDPDDGVTRPRDPAFRHAWVGGHFVSISDDLRADSDLAAGRCVARALPAALVDQPRFIHHVLEAHALQLVTQTGRTPLHAAAVSDGGRAMLLAGQGGSGKSTLCYALVRAGWRLIADDVSFLEEGATLRAWGNATDIRLLPDAVNLFPELAALQPRHLPNGKVKLEAPAPRRAHVGLPRALVVMGPKRQRVATLASMTAEAAIDFLFAAVGPGFDQYPGARATALAIARACAVARLSPAEDPNSSAMVLTRWFETEGESS